FFLILRIVVTRGRLLGVFFTLLVAHLFLVVMNPQFVLDPSNRYYIIGATFLGDTNDYTLSLCILAPMVIELALQQRSMLLKVFFWFVLVVIGLAIVSSQSRGAALGISAVLIYLWRSEEHTSELQSRENLVCRLLLEKKKKESTNYIM